MSAKMIDAVLLAGGKITAFESYTGGLIAPESDNNPWNYKFTWNPRNVVLAGQGTAKFYGTITINIFLIINYFQDMISWKFPVMVSLRDIRIAIHLPTKSVWPGKYSNHC